MEGQATDLEIEAREMLRLRDRIYHVYASATGRSFDQIERDCDRNKWLDEKVKKLDLTDQDKADLVAFMQACTGEFPMVERGRLPK